MTIQIKYIFCALSPFIILLLQVILTFLGVTIQMTYSCGIALFCCVFYCAVKDDCTLSLWMKSGYVTNHEYDYIKALKAAQFKLNADDRVNVKTDQLLAFQMVALHQNESFKPMWSFASIPPQLSHCYLFSGILLPKHTKLIFKPSTVNFPCRFCQKNCS